MKNYPIDWFKYPNKIKLLAFLYAKNRIINNILLPHTIKYLDKYDFDEIRNRWWWEENTCRFVIKEISNYLKNENINLISHKLCPWCIVNKSAHLYFCGSCNFGKRKGNCFEDISLYQTIKKIINIIEVTKDQKKWIMNFLKQ